MAALDELIARIPDDALRTQIQEAMKIQASEVQHWHCLSAEHLPNDKITHK